MWQLHPRAQAGPDFLKELGATPDSPQGTITASATQAPPQSPSSPIRETMTTAIGVLTLVSILVLLRRVIEHWKYSRLELIQENHPPRQTFPCQRCRYFNPSAFLYCAVNPATAMTAEAQSQPVAWSPGYAGACGECDLSGKNLTGWTLTGGNYASARLEYAFMRGVQAGNANFENAEATSADMRGAILTSARFSGAT
ncbi:hypothetical protein C7271_17965, partial [filamentous cyanobacterium CCP5]